MWLAYAFIFPVIPLTNRVAYPTWPSQAIIYYDSYIKIKKLTISDKFIMLITLPIL